MDNAQAWQHPFVDVFKRFRVLQSIKSAKKGKVSEEQDSTIGRPVLKIIGSPPSTNYITIPDPTSGIKSLGLKGKYIYLEFLPIGKRDFYIYLDFNIHKQEQTTRFAISNQWTRLKATTGNVLQIPFPRDAPQKWTVVVLSVEYYLQESGLFEHTGIESFEHLHTLKQVQLTSSILFRGLYTSDNIYTIKSLPKEMDFRAHKDQGWSDVYQLAYYPTEIDPDHVKDMAQKYPPPLREITQELLQHGDPLLRGSIEEIKKTLRRTSEGSSQGIEGAALDEQQLYASDTLGAAAGTASFAQPLPVVQEGDSTASPQRAATTSQQYQQQQQSSSEDAAKRSQQSLASRGGATYSTSQQQQQYLHQRRSNQSSVNRVEGLQPYPIARLQQTIGFSGKQCPDIRWSKHESSPKEIIYACGAVLVCADVLTGKQRFFTGHSAPIACLDVSRDGRWIVSAQESSRATVKIWDFLEGDCISSFDCQFEGGIKCVSFSYNRELLCTVGIDGRNRDLIILWNIDDLKELSASLNNQLSGSRQRREGGTTASNINQTNRTPTILARQVSDFNILSMKFSPIDRNRLVSCGRENIKFYRIKDDHVPGHPVILKHHARNTVFTVFDFEFAYEESSAANQSGTVKRIFVGSKHGMLYQVNYHTRELVGVTKCHDNAICSIALSAGFCATGSEDLYMRQWPLDLSDFFIQAKHEGVIISLDVSLDGLVVACGTISGSLGLLDLESQSYKTFLRSHTDEIVQMVHHKFSNYLITLSQDLTIRLWDLERNEQVYEFSYPPDDYCTTIAPYDYGLVFAAGFSSGALRLFDIEKTSITDERKYHDAAITDLQYTPDGKLLLVADAASFYCVYDATRAYQPIKTFEHETPGEHQSIAITQDSSIIATIGECGTHINVYEASSLTLALKIFCPNTTLKKLVFSSNNIELFVLTGECRLKVFALQKTDEGIEAYQVRELQAVHREGIEDIAYTPNFRYLASVGADSLLKVWDYDFSLQGLGSNQLFLGHVAKINHVLFLNAGKKILTAGGFEGIYSWDFLGDLTPSERNFNFKGLTPANVKRAEKKRRAQQQQQSLTDSKNEVAGRLEFSAEEAEEIEHEEEVARTVPQQALNVEAGLLIENQGEFEVTDSERGIAEAEGVEEIQQQNRAEAEAQEDVVQYFSRRQSEQQQRSSSDKKSIPKQSQRPQQQQQAALSSALSLQKEAVGNGSFIAVAKQVFAPRRLEFDFSPITIDYQKVRRAASQAQQRGALAATQAAKGRLYVPNQVRTKDALPFRQHFVDRLSNTLEEKIRRLRDNPQQLKLSFLVALNSDAHDNIVWNVLKGWFAYAVENYVVVEELGKDRAQKVLTFEDYVGVLRVSPDGKYLLVGASTRNDKEIANIHVVECIKFATVKQLAFHTRGVQQIQFSENGKYLVSIGNFKECTVAIWDWAAGGKLITSSYTMDKLNDLKVSTKVYGQNRLLEFVTVGRDQVQFWALTKDNLLECADTFIKKAEIQGPQQDEFEYSEVIPQNSLLPEVTAVDYFEKNGSQFVLCGLASGEIVIVVYGDFNVVRREQLASSEITQVSASPKRLVVTSLDGGVYYWDFADTPWRDFHPQFARFTLPAGVTVAAFDLVLNEGLAATIEGGIYYFNLNELYRSNLVGTTDIRSKPSAAKFITDDTLLTTHDDGKVRLWSAQTGEELFTYEFRSQVTAHFYSTENQKLTIFFRNDNEVKVLDIKKYTHVENYAFNEAQDSEKQGLEWPVWAGEGVLAGQVTAIVLKQSGDLYTFETLLKDKKPVKRLRKIAALPNASQIHLGATSEKSLLFVSNKRGTVQVFNIDYDSDSTPYNYVFTLVDEHNFLENPHGALLDRGEEQQTLTKYLYQEVQSTTQIVLSQYNQSCYYAANNSLQYLFMYNYQKHQLVQRINLLDFPVCLYGLEARGSFCVLVGAHNGTIEKINIEDREGRQILSGMLDGPILGLALPQQRNKLVITTPGGFCVYKF